MAGGLFCYSVEEVAKEGAITLTSDELLTAQRLKVECWLYVVVNAASNPELYLVQNPAVVLG